MVEGYLSFKIVVVVYLVDFLFTDLYIMVFFNKIVVSYLRKLRVNMLCSKFMKMLILVHKYTDIVELKLLKV